MANTKFIDLGYIYFDVFGDAVNGPTGGPIEQLYFGDLEDRILNSELNDGVNWSATPIGLWAGASNNTRAYGIEIKHLNAGNPTGKVFYVFISGGTRFATSPSELEEVFQNPNTYFSTTTQAFDGFLSVYYNPFGISNPMAWGVTNRFDAPTINPFSDAAGFFNHPASGQAKFISKTYNEAEPYPWGLLFNHDEPFVGYIIGYGRTSHMWQWTVAGDIFVPRDSGDPFVHGQVLISTNPAETNNDADILVCTGVDDQGNQEDYSLEGHKNFSRQNSPRSDGSYNADAIKVFSSTHDKGVIKPDIMAIQGPQGEEFLRFYAGNQGPRMKFSARFAVVMPDDISPPFTGYPQVPNPGFNV